MKKLFAVTAAAVAFTGTAQAQSFDGAYVGAAIVRDAYEVQAEDINLGGATLSADGLSGNGVGGQIFAGYTADLGGGFVGIEANGSLGDASISISATGVGSARVRARESYGISARGGFKLTDSTGLYARVGWQNTRFKATLDDGTGAVSESSTEDALTYGAGLETAIRENVSLRVEYTIEDYGDAGLELDGLKVENNKLSLGVAFRF